MSITRRECIDSVHLCPIVFEPQADADRKQCPGPPGWLVLIATAVENRCDYCTAGHSMLANNLGLARDQIDRLHRNHVLADARLEALRSFATAVVRNRGWLDEKVVADFLAAGFTKGQVREVLLGVSLRTLANYANHLAKPEVNTQFRDFVPDWNSAPRAAEAR